MKENTIDANQHKWLQVLQSLSKRPLRVSRNFEGKPSKWISVEDGEFPVDYRTVLHNEIVFDIDSTRWNEVRMFTEIVTDTLNKMNVPYTAAYTGGRGVHVHVFFSLSEDQKRQCVQIDVMPKDLRAWLFYYFLTDAGTSPKVIGPGKPFDTACVNWSDEGKGHLVRIFGGKKRNCKTMLSEIPEERPKKYDVQFPDSVNLWKIPDSIFKEFSDNFKKSQEKRVEACKRYSEAAQNFTGTYLNLPCVQKIFKGLPEGKRNAGARIVAIACRLDGVPEKDTEKVMLDYAGNCSQENISESEYLGWVTWIYAQEKTFWNCRFCKDLEVCDQQKCDLHESAFGKEHEFLKDENLLHNISRILDKKIKKEEKNKLIVLSVYLSAYGSNPLNLFLKGESSTGKTYLAKTVAEYFPEEDVWFIGDMSPKALIHEHGRFENGKMYISLENKILVFLETPRRQTLEMLKPILSHDRREIEYKVADRSSAGKLQTKSVIIEGWPATVFCTTDFKFLEELSTRSLLTTPETSQEKIVAVLEYKGSKYSQPWVEMEVDVNEEIFTSALKLLRSPKEVCVPYADELAQRYSKSEPRAMRDFDKLMELIRISAFLHQKQRPSFELEINGTKQFVIATECDYKIGVDLFDHIRETTVTGLPQSVLDFYEKVICQLEKITYSSMMKKFHEVYKKLIGRDTLRRKYVDPLVAVGWLDNEWDSIDKRQKVFEICRNEEENSQNIRNYAQLIFKDIYPEERLKGYLEGIEEKCAQNNGCSHIMYREGRLEPGNHNWFYCSENCAYFSDQELKINGKSKEENELKNEQRANAYISEEKNVKPSISKDNLLDQYDEETVLQQIPEEDTKVEDVMGKFKNVNKAADTIVVLQEKGKVMVGIMDGQNYIRRLSSTPQTKDPDVNTSRLNTWTCGKCGKKFQAQTPYEDDDGHAICKDCWKKVTDS
ncbi:MAG: hypothetical protein HXS48_04565 [Theionarchaea archaeon]|nr:hypothetical protein [Theionarchaea archaeon]